MDRQIIDNLIRARAEHIEAMAARFIQQAGPDAVLDYELVEERAENGLKITWYFRKRTET